MWNGKSKAVTFSFDDGVTQDIKVIELLNKYNIKGTFNLNSMLLGVNGKLTVGNTIVTHNKVNRSKVKEIYSGHEVAAHTLVHPNLTNLDEETIIYQVERDRIELSSLVDYDVVGMAYPCGGVNNNDRVAEIIKNNNIKSVKVARMEVPCCGGLENAVKRALQQSGKFIPWQVVTITTDGKILD